MRTVDGPHLPFIAINIRSLSENGVLGRLRNAELDNLLRSDLNGLTRLGVAAHAGLAADLDQLAESGNDNALGALGSVIRDREKLLVSGNGLLLADTGGIGDGSHDFGLGGRNFLGHFLDP